MFVCASCNEAVFPTELALSADYLFPCMIQRFSAISAYSLLPLSVLVRLLDSAVQIVYGFRHHCG